MRTHFLTALAVAMAGWLVVVTFSAGVATADADARQTPLADSDTHLSAPLASDLVVPGDEARGCCLFRSSPVRCSYANRGFCRTTANANGLRYEFYEDTHCRDVAACPTEQ